nr:N-acetylneuraminate lyase isoform X2 [Aotus nancymaae]
MLRILGRPGRGAGVTSVHVVPVTKGQTPGVQNVSGFRGRRFWARLAGCGAELQPPGSPAWRHVGLGRAAPAIKRGGGCRAERRHGRSGGLEGETKAERGYLMGSRSPSWPTSSSMAAPKKKLQGLVAATITPMTENGEINLSVIGQYVDYLVKEQGVKNIFVNGTTGEGLSLSVSERRRVAEEWMTKGKDKLDQVVIHVGALSLKESQELAQHAAEIGADGIAVIAPFFLKPWTKDVLINFLKEVAAAAPAVPFYYYHIPALTGVKIRAEELLDGIQDKIPTFQGLKFSDTDLLDFGQCVDQNRQQQFAFLFGVDEFCIQRFINFVVKLENSKLKVSTNQRALLSGSTISLPPLRRLSLPQDPELLKSKAFFLSAVSPEATVITLSHFQAVTFL